VFSVGDRVRSLIADPDIISTLQGGTEHTILEITGGHIDGVHLMVGDDNCDYLCEHEAELIAPVNDKEPVTIPKEWEDEQF